MRSRLFVLATLWIPALGLHAFAPDPAGNASLAAADEAWEQGDYIQALNGYIKLLSTSAGETYLERIALRTGELFKTW